ncbi:MAG: hypothetical protein B7Z73_11985 [Planctomycetia bacterium 21-64-5]|nr:MAG: hypothetical protein B7Z73_11985 [Planctomycetia bacterium 21-64-5]
MSQLAEQPASPLSPHGVAEGVEKLPLTVIEPHTGWQPIPCRELWDHRELLYFLAWRDVKVRYRQTLLGAAWAILQPALMMVVFTLVLGRLSEDQTAKLPYPLFAYSGLVAWSFFATALSSAAQSVVNAERLITKIYFPRFAIPLAAVAAAIVDLVMECLLLVPLMACYHQRPSWTLVFVPLAFVLLTLAALGFGALLAALNVRYRDVRYVLPFLVQIWLFATPSVYLQRSPSEDIGSREGDSSVKVPRDVPQADGRREWLALNPLDGLITFFRATLLGRPLPWRRLLYPALAIPVVLLFGSLYFRRVEDSFADVI